MVTCLGDVYQLVKEPVSALIRNLYPDEITKRQLPKQLLDRIPIDMVDVSSFYFY